MRRLIFAMLLIAALPCLSYSAVRFVDPATDTMTVDEGFNVPYIAEITTQEGRYFTTTEMESITKVRLYFGDDEYTDSALCAACFNWTTYKASSRVIISVGSINWTDSTRTATLFIYTPTYTSGLRVGTFAMTADGSLAVAGASPATGFYLDDLADVSITSIADNDILRYDVASGKWQNEAFSSAGGDVTGPSSSVDGNIVVFDGITGKIIKDGGAPPTDGLDGDDGREVELNKSATHVQWRYVGDAVWIDLIALAGITGADGAAGATGPTGPQGPTGPNTVSTTTTTDITGIIKGTGTNIAQATAGTDYQAPLTFGIANTNAVKIDSADAASGEYARFTANGLESRSKSEVATDLKDQFPQAITDNHVVTVDQDGAADNDFAKFTANGLEGRSYTETKQDLSLDNVPNLKQKLDATAAPGATNDTSEGYAVGSKWVDVTADKVYFCLDATEDAAVWQEVGAGGYTNLTSFVSQTAWRLFYSNADGDVTELALGTDGQVLTSTGASTAPAFESLPVLYKTIYIDAGAMVPATTTPAATGTKEYGTNDLDADYFAFDGGASEERVQFKMVMPEDYDLGTVKAKFYWSSATGSTAGDTVEWAIKAVAITNDGALDVAKGTAVTVSDTLLADSGADLQISAASGAMTIGGTPALGKLVVFEVYRNTDGTDDMTEDAWLFGVLIQYQQTATAMSAW